MDSEDIFNETKLGDILALFFESALTANENSAIWTDPQQLENLRKWIYRVMHTFYASVKPELISRAEEVSPYKYSDALELLVTNLKAISVY